MRRAIFWLLVLASMSIPTVVFADVYPLPDFVIEKRAYWSVEAGYLGQPKVDGKAHMPKFDFGYLWVDQGLVHHLRGGFGLNGPDQVLSFDYGVGFGPRSGLIHGGPRLGLGYGHFWNDKTQDDKTQNDLHGLILTAGLFVTTTPWFIPPLIDSIPALRFSLHANWVSMPLSSQDIPGSGRWTGLDVGIGAAFSFD
jgi:hypothetical protein